MDNQKVIVSYTEKVFQGIKAKEFDSRPLAEAWVKENQETVYWSSIRKRNPASENPKRVLANDVDLTGYIEIKGTLQTFFETGMECTGLILHDDFAPKGPENPKFDPTKPEDGNNFKHFSSYENIHDITSGDIFQPEGHPKYVMLKDRQFAADDAYRLSFYPQGFTYAEWTSFFAKQNIKATVWTKKR
jgi:hypothetical protein